MTRAETIAHLRRARERIDRDYATPLDLDALAAEAGFSRFHFARSFAEVYGEPPRAYLTRRRIERAKDLLRSANLTVTEVCLMMGFRSLGSFSARFSELVGISPSAYRSEQVRRGGPPPVPGCFLFAWSRPAPPRRPSRLPAGIPQARRSALPGRPLACCSRRRLERRDP